MESWVETWRVGLPETDASGSKFQGIQSRAESGQRQGHGQGQGQGQVVSQETRRRNDKEESGRVTVNLKLKYYV